MARHSNSPEKLQQIRTALASAWHSNSFPKTGRQRYALQLISRARQHYLNKGRSPVPMLRTEAEYGTALEAGAANEILRSIAFTQR